MPTIVVTSPKGGADKSTTAVLLGTELAHAGAEVVMLDCDPNRSLSLWADRSPLPSRIQLLGDVTESDIVPRLNSMTRTGRLFWSTWKASPRGSCPERSRRPTW